MTRSDDSVISGHRIEGDASVDAATVLPEGAGGEPMEGVNDQNVTTGTTPNDEYVGRVAGDDGGGYEGETGAERRAQAAGA